MLNIVLAITMETVYQVVLRELNLTEKDFSRAKCYQTVPSFPGLCFLCLADPKAASRRLFP